MANKKKKETPPIPEDIIETRPPVFVKAEVVQPPTILNRNGIFLQLGPRKKNLYPNKPGEVPNGWSQFIRACNDLAMSNNLDLQYRVVKRSGQVLSLGSVSDDFLRDLSQITGSYEFSSILYDPNKDLIAIYQWPDLDLETFRIKEWVNFESKRIVWILGLWS
jgi:hypothetical protein